MKFSIIDAAISLVPGAELSCSNEVLTWINPKVPPVTEAELQAELIRLQQDYDNKEYQRLRAAAYPAIGDQLDALFHAGVFPSEMAAKLQAVKDQFPKS